MAGLNLGPNAASLLNTGIAALPGIIDAFRKKHEQLNPGAPPPTSEQVIAALQSDVVADALKDEQLLAELNKPGYA